MVSIGLYADQVGPTPDFKAGITQVEIPVRVLDNKGRFVSDLTRADFEVFEDGAPQRVISFSLNGLSSRVDSLQDTKQRASTRESAPRFYAVVLDDFHISREDSVKARSLVLEFIRRYAAADDNIAVEFTSGSRGQEFTRDRSVLSSAIGRLRGQ
jgi:VWFA-related protein